MSDEMPVPSEEEQAELMREWEEFYTPADPEAALIVCIVCGRDFKNRRPDCFQLMWAVGHAKGEMKKMRTTMPMPFHAGYCWQVLEHVLERHGPFILLTFNMNHCLTYPKKWQRHEDVDLTKEALDLLQLGPPASPD